MRGPVGDAGALIACSRSFVDQQFPGYRLSEVSEVTPPKRGIALVKGKLKFKHSPFLAKPEPVTLKLDAG